MAFPKFTMKELIEAGAHFGHHTRRWNPKMAPYVFGVRDKIHIIDLQKTVPMLHAGLAALRNTVAQGGKVLFVGTKRQAQDIVRESAEVCGQYYVNKRWLGGLLTNWKTVVNSIRKLKKTEADILDAEKLGLTKKEVADMEKETGKLRAALGGVMDMNGGPDILFVIDTAKEDLSVMEANKLGIPVVGICDTNSDPTNVDYPIPGNDDAIKAIKLYSDLAVKAILDGLEEQLKASGVDLGAALNPEAKVKNESPEDKKEA
ncbi:MAG: 30S ribosomal protein S2 [Rickettsiales bacterium]|jgi:small subunit ribosomal protein S2|nr:30S ribosomal protein S2 [Rickettsiales bacterium]